MGKAGIELVFDCRPLALVEGCDMCQRLCQCPPPLPLLLRLVLPYIGSSGDNLDHCLPPHVLQLPPRADSPRQCLWCQQLALFLGWAPGPCGAKLLALTLAKGMGPWRACGLSAAHPTPEAGVQRCALLALLFFRADQEYATYGALQWSSPQ